MFDSQFFQQSLAKKKRKDDNARQTNSTKNLHKRETNTKSSTNFNYNILSIDRRQVFVFIVFATSKKDSSTIFFASRKIKQTKNCLSN